MGGWNFGVRGTAYLGTAEFPPGGGNGEGG